MSDLVLPKSVIRQRFLDIKVRTFEVYRSSDVAKFVTLVLKSEGSVITTGYWKPSMSEFGTKGGFYVITYAHWEELSMEILC